MSGFDSAACTCGTLSPFHNIGCDKSRALLATHGVMVEAAGRAVQATAARGSAVPLGMTDEQRATWPPTPAAMLGEALEHLRKARGLMLQAGVSDVAPATLHLDRAVEDVDAIREMHARNEAQTRQRYAEKRGGPTIFGAPVVEDPSVPAGHVDVVRRDGKRVRFDLRKETERMEAEARAKCPHRVNGADACDCAAIARAEARDPSPGVG